MANKLPPAEIGMKLNTVDTPALVLNLDIFESNRKAMTQLLRGLPITFRPHAKSHKCPQIAKLQIQDGASGICCQKVSEAEVMVEAGIQNILITNQIVGTKKIARLIDLAKLATVSVCVDNIINVDQLSRSAERGKVKIDVLAEIDVGTGRCGVRDEQELLELARYIRNCKNLTFRGIQAYHGRAQHVRDYQERRQHIRKASGIAGLAVETLKQNEITCDLVSGSGTGTIEFEANNEIFNEVQPGSYIFMDGDYSKNLDARGQPITTFCQSLFLLTTVMSRPTESRAVVVVGLKSVATDSGLPTTLIDGVTYRGASDEHGILEIKNSNSPQLGEKIKLTPGHCDPTVNLHDWIIGYRGDRVREIWPIEGRGAFF